MNIKTKKLIGFSVIFIALIWSGFLIFSPIDKNNSNSNQNLENQPFVVTQKSNDPTLLFQSVPLENLTLKFANDVFKKAAENKFYQSSGNINDLKIIPPNKKELEKSVSQIIDEEFSKPAVATSDIIISEDNSKENQIAYIVYLNEVLQHIPTYTISTNTSSQPSLNEIFIQSAQNFDMAINLLKIVHVPPAWVNIHYKILNLLAIQRNLFIDLTKSDNDPVRFMTALYTIQNDPFMTGMEMIKKEIEQKIKDEKLS